MNFLSLMEAKLPPGFRFHPRDEELVMDYLEKKVVGNGTQSSLEFPTIIELDLNKIEPWDLPEMACVGGKEWYFFSLRDRKYATGLRTNRATISGYWKATGKDRKVMDMRSGTLVGMRKTLVFYQGRAPKGQKTDWIMHEFRLEGPRYLPKISSKEDWVLCRAFNKNRGTSAKVCQETSYYDDTGSSLPPLMDTFFPFEQTPLSIEGYEQVPCFSSFSPNQTTQGTNPTLAPLSQVESNLPTSGFDQSSVPLDLTSLLYPIPEKELIKAVLDHFNKAECNKKMMEVFSPGFDEGSSDSYLSGMGLSTVWNQCFF